METPKKDLEETIDELRKQLEALENLISARGLRPHLALPESEPSFPRPPTSRRG